MNALIDAINSLNSATASAAEIIAAISNAVWGKLFLVIVAAGLIITVATRTVQWRSISQMFRSVVEPSGNEADGRKGISSFRAFTVSAASRVGTGNIAGVALAISMGWARCRFLDVGYCRSRCGVIFCRIATRSALQAKR